MRLAVGAGSLGYSRARIEKGQVSGGGDGDEEGGKGAQASRSNNQQRLLRVRVLRRACLNGFVQTSIRAKTDARGSRYVQVQPHARQALQAGALPPGKE